MITLWGDHHAAETVITTSAVRHWIWSLYEFINNIVTLWQLLWDKLFRTTHISISICSARHFIASLDFFYCSSRCSSGYHQRDLCKLITAKESPELNKHIQAGNGPRLLLWLNKVWSPLVCSLTCMRKESDLTDVSEVKMSGILLKTWVHFVLKVIHKS